MNNPIVKLMRGSGAHTRSVTVGGEKKPYVRVGTVIIRDAKTINAPGYVFEYFLPDTVPALLTPDQGWSNENYLLSITMNAEGDEPVPVSPRDVGMLKSVLQDVCDGKTAMMDSRCHRISKEISDGIAGFLGSRIEIGARHITHDRMFATAAEIEPELGPGMPDVPRQAARA